MNVEQQTPAPPVVEVTNENFEAEVVARSRERPVVVDFWAPWCGPCRTLGPLLEKLAAESAGEFVLAKANTEVVPEIAAEFAVRSIPAVFAVRDGRVVDAFVGALPESQVRAWLKGVMPGPAERLVMDARALEPTDLATAEAKYREALTLAPTDPATKTGLARVLLHQGKVAEAHDLITALEGRGFLEPEAETVKAELSLREQSATVGDVATCRAALAAEPKDPARKLALAESLAATGGYEEALELALGVVEEGKKDAREEARRVMVNIFQLLPDDSEVAAEYRRKLSAALY